MEVSPIYTDIISCSPENFLFSIATENAKFTAFKLNLLCPVGNTALRRNIKVKSYIMLRFLSLISTVYSMYDNGLDKISISRSKSGVIKFSLTRCKLIFKFICSDKRAYIDAFLFNNFKSAENLTFTAVKRTH